MSRRLQFYGTKAQISVQLPQDVRTHMLNKSTHTSLCNAATPKNLYSVCGDLLAIAGAEYFEQSNLTDDFWVKEFGVIEQNLPNQFLRLLVIRLRWISLCSEEWLVFTILFIWCVTFSSQVCSLSHSAIIAASLFRMTACANSGLPPIFRWFIHLCPVVNVVHYDKDNT